MSHTKRNTHTVACDLIEITSDYRAVISVPHTDGPGGDIRTTEPLSRVDFQQQMLVAGGQRYDFGGEG